MFDVESAGRCSEARVRVDAACHAGAGGRAGGGIMSYPKYEIETEMIDGMQKASVRYLQLANQSQKKPYAVCGGVDCCFIMFVADY